MAAETASGELIVGDSHEYGLDPEPFDKPEIDALILQYLQSFLETGEYSVSRRWNGVYAKHPAQQWFRNYPFPNVEILTGVGGAGMTLSFGLADQTVRAWK